VQRPRGYLNRRYGQLHDGYPDGLKFSGALIVKGFCYARTHPASAPRTDQEEIAPPHHDRWMNQITILGNEKSVRRGNPMETAVPLISIGEHLQL
jgi:hypothetical protein